MLSIISKQTREKTNRQGKRHTRKNKQTTTKKKQKKQKKQQQGLCTHQMEPTFGDRKQFQTQNMVDIYIYFFERLLNLRQKEN